MVGQELEHLAHIVDAAVMKIAINIVGHRDRDGAVGGQLRVQPFGAGEADQVLAPLPGGLDPRTGERYQGPTVRISFELPNPGAKRVRFRIPPQAGERVDRSADR